MISILIPTYNHSIVSLVTELQNQCSQATSEYEIFVLDDNSEITIKKENKAIQSLPHVLYEELEQNIGRSKIRNQLGRKAQYPYLLFIDCDAEITNKDFITNYLQHCDGANTVVCGGTAYSTQKPDTNHLLRWEYGRKYEMKSAQQRELSPNKSFSAFNFLISKDLFLSIEFDESLSKYGHEDSLFGFQLSQKKIAIKHIDNPLVHLGLDSNSIFIDKTKESIANVILLQNRLPESFKNEIRLLNLYNKLKTFHCTKVIAIWYKLFENKLLHKLQKSPSIFKFNLFKICYLYKLLHQEK